MGKFYLDMEFINGNYYLADILEIALETGKSGYAFHSYVKIHYSVLKRVQRLTDILRIELLNLLDFHLEK